MNVSYDIVVIGSGPAGQKAAVQAAKAGKRVALIEKEQKVGGACVHWGTIPSKTLREKSLQIVRMKHDSRIINFQMPEHVQLSTLMHRMESVLDSHHEYMSEQLNRNDVVIIHGRASFTSADSLDIEHIDGSHTVLKARNIIIATGSRPRKPDNVDIDHENILDSDSVLSMLYLPDSLIVLGDGVIASEYASIFALLGSKVTMISGGERPLGFLDSEMSERFLEAFRAFGGSYINKADIEHAGWDGLSKTVVKLADGNRIESEKTLCAMGRIANVEKLKIENAGIKTTSSGLIDVDENYKTSVDNIYAVGDVIGPPSLASTSMEQGRRAACHILGLNGGSSFELIPVGIFTIPEIATVGISEQEAIERFGGAMVGRANFSEIARGQIEGEVDGLVKMVADPQGKKLLGVQIAGESAAELIHIGQMGLLSGSSIDLFVENIFNFPTLAEAYRVAALEIVRKRQPLHAVSHPQSKAL